MPTGYTAPIADGISFEQFVWGCARGMGALVMMRDEPSNAPIPERFEPSDYHQKNLDRLRGELEALRAMTREEVRVEADKTFHADLECHNGLIKKANDLRAKYEAMLVELRAWEPPQDHVEFKAFMEKQILESIDFDCETKYYDAPEGKSTDGYLAITEARLHRDIAYHTERHAKEVELTEGRNKWIADLRASLKVAA